MSKNRHKYFNKVPPFKQDPEHYTRKHHSLNAKVCASGRHYGRGVADEALNDMILGVG